MLAWLDSSSPGSPSVPTALEGWEPRAGYAVCHRDVQGGHLVGIGDPITFVKPRVLHDLGSPWSVGLVTGEAFSPRVLGRVQAWADVAPVRDLKGREWFAPLIRTAEGRRAFRVTYGRDWLPALTVEQARAEEICAAALDAIVANGGAPIAVACQWAAELLCMTHHLTPEVIAACELMDQTLVVAVLEVAASLPLERGDS